MTEPASATRSYTIIGAGGVGLLYGTRLAAAGHPVRWLVRNGAEQLASDGIAVRSEGREYRIDPEDVVVATEGAELPSSDVVLVATKTTANHRLTDLVSSVCAPGATVALFQNGLGAEEIVRSEVPAAGAVVGGMCFVCVHRRSYGVADHLDYGPVTLATLDDHGDADAADAIGLDLQDAGIETTVLADLGVARWRKLVWNIPFNGLCVVLDAPTDQLLGLPATRGLVADLMDEVIVGAEATGNGFARAFRDEMLEITDAMTSYEPSMLLDRRAGRALEIPAIYDVAIDAARAAGAPMRKVEMLAAQLRFLDPARR